MNPRDLKNICRQFLPLDPETIAPYGDGRINKTFLVANTRGPRFILQEISPNFENVPALMQNYANITKTIARHLKNPPHEPGDRRVQHLIDTNSGLPYYLDKTSGLYYRMMPFIENSTTPTTITPAIMNSAGKAIGEFHAAVANFPVDQLFETLPRFHDTPNRVKNFLKSLAKDTCGFGALALYHKDIDVILKRAQTVAVSYATVAATPKTVTHNDTKLNNILFDEKTLEPLCLIDLDTVMPGYLAYDFGDAVRFGANLTGEVEHHLENVSLDLPRFRAFCKGFLATTVLPEKTINSLVHGCWLVTFELAVRLFDNYFSGNDYFHFEDPNYGIAFARTQLALAKDIERKFDQMNSIVWESVNN